MENQNIVRLVSRLFDEHIWSEVWEDCDGAKSVVVGKEMLLDALRFKLNQRELLIDLMNEDEK